MAFIAIALFMLVCLAGAFCLNAAYKRTSCYRDIFADTEQFRHDAALPSGLQLVNLGSSHPKFGFDYDGLDLRAMNWAVRPQSLEYDFAILRHGYRHLADKAVVLIPVCVLQFFLYRHGADAQLKYYGILPKEDIAGYSVLTRLRRIDFPLLFHPGLLKLLWKPVRRDPDPMLTDRNPMTGAQLKADADAWIDGWNREFGIDIHHLSLSEANARVIRHNVRLLHQMIQFCLDKGLQPVVCVLPVSEYLGSRFSDEFVSDHILAHIAEANTQSCPVLNHLRDSRFADSSLYLNSFFFNLHGRKAFTRMLVDELKNKKLL